MNKGRLISSTFMISLCVLGVINNWAMIFVVMFLTIGGLYEFFHMIKKKGIPIYSYMGIFIGALIPLSTFMRFEPTRGWELLFVVLALVTIFILQLRRNESANAIVGISTTLFGVLYVSWLFSFLIKIRFLMPGWEGAKLLAFILIIIKVGDIGALLIGSKFGKHLLMPKVSPNKTIEGGIKE